MSYGPRMFRVAGEPASAHKEKYYYRCDVRMWTRRVRVFASGGDSKANGIANGLVHALYAAMDLCYCRILDADIQDSKLTLDAEDEDTIMPFDEQG